MSAYLKVLGGGVTIISISEEMIFPGSLALAVPC